MPTPSTRTPVRIARGSYSNLNGSVSDLQDGEISYAEDQNKLYVKEGSSLVALTYTPASPAFTGTITGVNLTLSGNLTVNGTQTIINTQTLDVEDKQIEIGKVSSPSDTTADQGGWKLKGATDKTFLWVNATDAWTSSEHIELSAGKNFSISSSADSNDFAISQYEDSAGIYTLIGQNLKLDGNGNTTILDSGHRTAGIMFDARNNGRIEFITGDTNARAVGLTLDKSQNATFAGTVTATEYKLADDEVIRWGTSDSATIQGADLGSGGYIKFNAANGLRATIDVNGVSDAKGNLRSIPSSAKSGAYVLVAADAGKAIYTSTGGVTINNSLFSAGDAVTIINNSGSDQTITQGSGVTIHNAADAATGNRTLTGRGMATVWFASASVAYISGAGLS